MQERVGLFGLKSYWLECLGVGSSLSTRSQASMTLLLCRSCMRFIDQLYIKNLDVPLLESFSKTTFVSCLKYSQSLIALQPYLLQYNASLLCLQPTMTYFTPFITPCTIFHIVVSLVVVTWSSALGISLSDPFPIFHPRMSSVCE